ncbi:MAG: hypothetical protein KatS3mg023_3637 [Armatimonadota bacterium]|nr:MAG: hypothetical protein KatS3mg023_3637 [Armatimonadota bacterium]
MYRYIVPLLLMLSLTVANAQDTDSEQYKDRMIVIGLCSMVHSSYLASAAVDVAVAQIEAYLDVSDSSDVNSQDREILRNMLNAMSSTVAAMILTDLKWLAQVESSVKSISPDLAGRISQLSKVMKELADLLDKPAESGKMSDRIKKLKELRSRIESIAKLSTPTPDSIRRL